MQVLSNNGYILRPRYREGWTPSWLGTGRWHLDYEDGIDNLVRGLRNFGPSPLTAGVQPYFHVLDATDLSGEEVSIKVVTNTQHPNEIAISQYLGSKKLLEDSRNHCVPVYDVLADPCGTTNSLLVMKRLRDFNDPAFTAVGEALDFIAQTLEVRVLVSTRRFSPTHRTIRALSSSTRRAWHTGEWLLT